MNNGCAAAVLSRPDAEVLYAQLEHKARRQVRRRSLLRQTGIASTAIVLPLWLPLSCHRCRARPPRLTRSCDADQRAYNSHYPITPCRRSAIALFGAYGGEAIPEDVVAQCADQDENATGVGHSTYRDDGWATRNPRDLVCRSRARGIRSRGQCCSQYAHRRCDTGRRVTAGRADSRSGCSRARRGSAGIVLRGVDADPATKGTVVAFATPPIPGSPPRMTPCWHLTSNGELQTRTFAVNHLDEVITHTCLQTE